MNQSKLDQAISRALAAPAAPARLVEQVFAKTTRRKSWFTRYKMAMAGGVAAVLVAVCVGVGYFHTTPFDNADLVAYMSHTQGDEYATFLSDLNLLEETF